MAVLARLASSSSERQACSVHDERGYSETDLRSNLSCLEVQADTVAQSEPSAYLYGRAPAQRTWCN